VHRYGTTGKIERETDPKRMREIERERKGSKRKKGWLRRFRRGIKREETKRQLERELRGSVGRWSVDKKKRGFRTQKITLARVHTFTLILSSDDPPDGCESLRKRRLGFPK